MSSYVIWDNLLTISISTSQVVINAAKNIMKNTWSVDFHNFHLLRKQQRTFRMHRDVRKFSFHIARNQSVYSLTVSISAQNIWHYFCYFLSIVEAYKFILRDKIMNSDESFISVACSKNKFVMNLSEVKLHI